MGYRTGAVRPLVGGDGSYGAWLATQPPPGDVCWLGVPLDKSQLHDLVRGLDDDGCGMVSLDAWSAALAPELPEFEPSTQDALAKLHLEPLPIRELRHGATLPPPRAEPVPYHALSRFRFRTMPHKSLSVVWSTKHAIGHRAELSLWAPELDTTPLSKRSRVRVCLGHTCVDGLEAPNGKAGRSAPLVMEVTDGAVAMGLGSSEHLASVVAQLLPCPIRYRLAWHSLQHKPPLYLWRAVPPSGQFLALGMIATTGEEPPSLTAMHCVPRRWCERQQAGTPPRLVWRDDGSCGGRPGSFWSLPLSGLVVAANGMDPPEEALDCWTVASEKASPDNTGWLVQQ